uniref:Uncharacterized protein n=1 Tax=Aegilops tauschii TaxID=37682 RepID=R7W353_AEGTA
MAVAAPFIAMASNISTDNVEKRRRTSSDMLQRTVSDVSFQLHHHGPAKEEEEAAAEAGRKAAVTEEAEKNGGSLEEALRTHMGVCKRFNGFGRTYPVLFQAEAMREILRKRSKLGPRSRSGINPREVRETASKAKAKASAGAGGIARSSSCMPFITDEFSD